MKRLTVGILAHVDAGKTTLSESILYVSGNIRKLGRVDNQDAFLDTNHLERERGITIFSKQAMVPFHHMVMTLLDTPGHVDFSAEMERTLQVLDYAILVISGADGVQGHTKTLWRLLKQYKIPTVLFVNKMDQPGTNKEQIMSDLHAHLNENCIDFTMDLTNPLALESVAMCEEHLLNEYLENGTISLEEIQKVIQKRSIFPCYFGSALKVEGVEELLKGIEKYLLEPEPKKEFGAKIYKITRDVQGNRLTHMKVTGGVLRVKDLLLGQDKQEKWKEKVNQIRIYSGEKYESVNEAKAGTICAVTGLTKTYPGQGMGVEEASVLPILEPVLTYRVDVPPECSPASLYPKLKQLEEEEPELHIVWKEELNEIQVQLMGEVQIDVLRRMIQERFDVAVKFGMGNIVYKETITNKVEGVGHFEPLRHYAEVHLLLEPGELGSGMEFATNCSEDVLHKNWQRLILTHLEEREHVGVLTGATITDMKITLIAGKAHPKHTEGGDFRQATYRAIRQGLMEAESILLEPMYDFTLQIPATMVGKAMMDIETMYGRVNPPEITGEEAILTGVAPVITMRDYQMDVHAYTRGTGHLTCTLRGYEPCHNQEEVVMAKGYDPEADVVNPTGSVFCAHGSGYPVKWYEVKEKMHLESPLAQEEKKQIPLKSQEVRAKVLDDFIGEDEIQAIFRQTFDSNKKESKHYKKKNVAMPVGQYAKPKKQKSGKRYLIVDGYNIVYAWDELRCHIEDNLDGARLSLMDILCNYQAFTKLEVILVFDAYKVKGNLGEMIDYHNIHVIYTKEAETADQYIEKLTHEMGEKHDVTVATSDGLVQLIARGEDCRIYSARDLKEEVERVNQIIREEYLTEE